MGVCNCSMFCCTLLYVHYSIAIILMGERELGALLNLSSWCIVMMERLFRTVPRGCLWFVIVVFPDHTHLLFWNQRTRSNSRMGTYYIFFFSLFRLVMLNYFTAIKWNYINDKHYTPKCFILNYPRNVWGLG